MSRRYQFYQDSSRRMSQWMRLAPTTHISCCDCGLVHTFEFKVVDDRGKWKFQARCRRHVGKTKELRRKRRFPKQ